MDLLVERLSASFPLVLSRIGLAVAFLALALTFFPAGRPRRRPIAPRRDVPMTIATLALGLALFALFFGLVSECDRL